ncbi:glycosyltransferase family 2 protein [Brevibacterium sp. CT2-23B]|uniref:glycosyltransferase family 2 protein n=1 Tax=Brevibacterium sp. CT2-23B TaxID=2729630 RepID=UPI001556B638
MPDRSFQYDRFRRLGSRADSWALSSESSIAKDLFAAAASRGKRSFKDLCYDVAEADLSGWDTIWVARLARILSLQPFESALHDFAFKAMEASIDSMPEKRVAFQLRKTFFELVYGRKDYGRALAMLDRDNDLDEFYHGFLRADVLNPFVGSSIGDFDKWLSLFNRPFLENDVSGVYVDVLNATPFDGLTSTVSAGIVDGPLVTVIITTYNPDPAEIRTSVQSILNQTWKNIEVLLIDDCSGAASVSVLTELSEMDSRIRLIRLKANGGTYRARNVGIEYANGVYLTGQDTDDWSHPDRITEQVAVMESDPTCSGVTVSANRTDDRLVKVALGHHPQRRCEVSLMVRSKTAREIGGYLPVRKAADSEFRERIEAWTQRPAERIEAPLYVIRMSPGSLSRADFRPGWSHHVRRAFWSGYKYWHGSVSRDELPKLAGSSESTVSNIAPPRIAGGDRATRRSFDVCVVSDWRGTTVEQRAAFDELKVLATSDLSVCILQLDTPWGQTGDPRALYPDVQRLINEGFVQRIFLDEEADVDLIVVRDPSAVDYARDLTASISASRVLMVSHGNPKHHLETSRPYDIVHASDMAESIFQVKPEWVTTDGFESAELYEHWRVDLATGTYPIYIDSQRFQGPRLPRTDSRPVVGRTAENDTDEWPSRRLLPTVYPTDGRVDFRVLGDARGAVRVMRQKQVPNEWLQFKVGDIGEKEFWRTVDAMILFDQERGSGGLERSVLEALAAGVLVIVGGRRAEIYGSAVHKSEPEGAIQDLWSLISGGSELDEYRTRGYELVQMHSNPTAIIEFIDGQVRAARSEGE